MDIIWKDRKHTFLGLPWSFTRYSLAKDKLMIDKGFFCRNEEEIRLYRILDITLKRTLGQRLFGLGTIHLCTSDKTSPEVDIKSIKKSREIKEMLSDMVEQERDEKRVAFLNFVEDGGTVAEPHEN